MVGLARQTKNKLPESYQKNACINDEAVTPQGSCILSSFVLTKGPQTQ